MFNSMKLKSIMMTISLMLPLVLTTPIQASQGCWRGSAGWVAASEQRKLNAQLIKAAQEGRLDDIEKALKDVADINAKDSNGFTALRTTVSRSYTKIVKLLQQQKLNAEFIKAAEKGRLQDVEKALKDGVDVNAKGRYGFTALMDTAIIGHTEVVKLLLTAPGIDVNAQNNYGGTALMKAASYGHIKVVELLLTVPDIDVNAKDKFGWTALMLAALKGGSHQDIVDLLNLYNRSTESLSDAIVLHRQHGISRPMFDLALPIVCMTQALDKYMSSDVLGIIRAYMARDTQTKEARQVLRAASDTRIFEWRPQQSCGATAQSEQKVQADRNHAAAALQQPLMHYATASSSTLTPVSAGSIGAGQSQWAGSSSSSSSAAGNI